MNIVAIAGSSIPSDTANSIQVMKACSALVELGHSLTLIVPEFAGRPQIDIQRHYGIPCPFPIEWLPSPSRRLFPILAFGRALRHRPELIYTWFPFSAALGLLARTPVVLEAHFYPTGRFGPLWHWAFVHLPGQKRLVCITQALLDILERDFGTHLRPEEIVIAPNGVELERFASLPNPEQARRALGLPSAPTVVCAGHLYPGRGADLFLELAKSLPEVQFVWVGGRPADVQEWTRRATGIQNIAFLGFVPNHELPRYLAAADVLLMPYGRVILGSSGSLSSAAVASPMKMFEYMAAGRPILSSDLPVIREVLDETMAVFAPPEDVSAWRSALIELLSDPQRRARLAANARRVIERYTWSARARAILAGW